MATRDELRAYFDNVDEGQRQLAYEAIDEYIYFSEKIAELRKYPTIAVSERNPQLQKVTAAGKMIKEYSQVIDAKRNFLFRVLSKQTSDDSDALLDELEAFE